MTIRSALILWPRFTCGRYVVCSGSCAVGALLSFALGWVARGRYRRMLRRGALE